MLYLNRSNLCQKFPDFLNLFVKLLNNKFFALKENLSRDFVPLFVCTCGKFIHAPMYFNMMFGFCGDIRLGQPPGCQGRHKLKLEVRSHKNYAW